MASVNLGQDYDPWRRKETILIELENTQKKKKLNFYIIESGV